MMLTQALMMVLSQDPKPVDAKNLLRVTMQQVQRAKSFEAVIEQHDSSGLFPGVFSQRLRWQKGVGFDLVVTDRGSVGGSLPNYFCRGDKVTSVFRDMRSMVEPSRPGPNVTPSWEVLGGLNMSFLQQSPLSVLLFAEPPKPVPIKNLPPDAEMPQPTTITYVEGTRDKWQGERVREIIASVSGKNPYAFSVFLHPTSRYVIGMEAKNPVGEVGWMIYRGIKIDGEMPSDLGRVPGG